MNYLLVFGSVIISIIIGIPLGMFMARFVIALKFKKIARNAVKVINGEMKNEIEIEGKRMDVKTFKMEDPKTGATIVVDITGKDVGVEAPKQTKEVENG